MNFKIIFNEFSYINLWHQFSVNSFTKLIFRVTLNICDKFANKQWENELEKKNKREDMTLKMIIDSTILHGWQNIEKNIPCHHITSIIICEVDMCKSSQPSKISMFDNPLRSWLLFASIRSFVYSSSKNSIGKFRGDFNAESFYFFFFLIVSRCSKAIKIVDAKNFKKMYAN